MDPPTELRHPHALIFPYPAQGHANSMLKLAELLCLGGVNITFLVTRGIHDGLLRHADVLSRFAKYHGFRLDTLPDEGCVKSPDNADGVLKLRNSLKLMAQPFLRKLLAFDADSERCSLNPPITVIIIDWMISIALDVAQESGVPVLNFRTASASSFWSFFCVPQLIQAGELPFDDHDLDTPIANVKGMENFLRRRDLPNFLRGVDIADQGFRILLNENRLAAKAQGFIVNTFEDLEGPIVSQIRTECPNVYSIGPLHAHLKIRLQEAGKWVTESTKSSNSLWKEDRSCIMWLDQQPSKSVIYVSFGSIITVTRDQLLEFWHGLVNSGFRFLWVIRPDSIMEQDGESRIPFEMEKATMARGYFVEWAPQEEVLAHPAVGGFLTHSGWNSTLESIVEGVPMICWANFADQLINSRFVGEVWKLGLDMKDTCERAIIEKMVRDLMEARRDEFSQRAEAMAKLAGNAIREGGSSSCNLDRLIEDIRLMSIPSKSNSS